LNPQSVRAAIPYLGPCSLRCGAGLAFGLAGIATDLTFEVQTILKSAKAKMGLTGATPAAQHPVWLPPFRFLTRFGALPRRIRSEIEAMIA